ncbi:MAG: hypothetical protein JW787_18795 [Sedimentisphaerales bacterium]|nr:hypothetical protein [Sedimentisphaerales bacterium]
MRKFKKIIKTAICLNFLLIISAGIAGVSTETPASPYELISKYLQKKPQPNTKIDKRVLELLDNFAAEQKKLISFTATIELSTDVNAILENNTHHYQNTLARVRFDEKRACSHLLSWGEIVPNNHYEKEKPYHKSHWWDGIAYYMYDKSNWENESYKGTLIIKLYKSENNFNGRETILAGYTACSWGMGYLPQIKDRVDKIIRNADSAHVREKMEIVGDSDCFIIEAKAKTGSYLIWIDPSHGYNIAKLELRSKPGDQLSGGYVLPENDGFSVSINNVKFKKFDDIWIAIEADCITERYKLTKENHQYKITEFVLNPDHIALDSFIPDDIYEGVRVRLVDSNNTQLPGKFTWKNKKVMDSYGHEIDLDNLGHPSLSGKVLPDLAQFNVKLEPDAIKNKMLLICFWDMNQRPSRNAVQTLNKRAQTLLEKNDVYMTFIHAGPTEEQAFVSWLKENEIHPPVGVSRTGLPELGYIWGVKSLPWLILTDKQHKVIAEGFGIADLDEKLDNN